MSNTWLISGANRGIGLGYASQLLAMGEKVIAGVRDPDNAESLTELSRQYKPLLSIGRLDMNDWDSIDSFAGSLEERRIDYLINNAGLYGGSWTRDSQRQSVDSMDYELWEEIMRVNVIAQFRLTRALEESSDAERQSAGGHDVVGPTGRSATTSTGRVTLTGQARPR